MPDQEFWKFFNTFAPWFSAIGSLSAVITTLYLARRDRRLNLSVRADYETLSILTTKTDEYRVDEESFVCITVTNHGRRSATVTSILWKVGVFKRKTWLLKFDEKDDYTSKLPSKMEDGDEVSYRFPIKTFFRHFPNIKLHPFLRCKVFFMRVILQSSIGRSFSTRLSKTLRKELVKWIRSELS